LIFILGLRVIKVIKGYCGRAHQCRKVYGCCPRSHSDGIDVPEVPAPIPANESYYSSSLILYYISSFLANSILPSVNPFKFFTMAAGKPAPGRSHHSRENILLNPPV
jgi:hypothetical protein